MDISVIQIGNKKGIKPREGWEDAFKEMNTNGDDKLLLPDVFEDEDLGE